MLGLDKALCWSPPMPRAPLLTDTGLEKKFATKTVYPFGDISLRASFYSTSFFGRDPSAKIHMTVKRQTVLYRLSEERRVSSCRVDFAFSGFLRPFSPNRRIPQAPSFVLSLAVISCRSIQF